MTLKRWLVMVKDTGAVLSVVWDHWWFQARENAEQVHRDEFRIGQLLVEECPLLPEEEKREHPYSAAQLAPLLGKTLHRPRIVRAPVDRVSVKLRESLLALKKKKKAGRTWKKKAKHRRS